MCYSALVRTDLESLEKEFGASFDPAVWDRVYESWQADPKRVRLPEEDRRIFPGYTCGVLTLGRGKRVVAPMRYGAYPPPYIDGMVAAKLSTFNARRDSLVKPFWGQAFLRHHGILLVEGFYEWVSVRDLLEAGRVKIDDVTKEFARQSALRKERILAAGKRYKPTATELKPAIDRQIVIEFRAQDYEPLFVAAICSRNGEGDFGFALVTDEPTDEIRSAGHDRMPLSLPKNLVSEWLNAEHLDHQRVEALFAKARELKFVHQLAKAA